MDEFKSIGIWVSMLGTLIGIISLLYAVYISKTATDIKNNLLNLHIQSEYKRSKHSLLKELGINYLLIKENGIIQRWDIKEKLIDLYVYRNILSKDTLKRIKKLKKLINNKKEKVGFIRKRKSEEVIGELLYSLIAELQKDFKEKENWLEVMTR